MTKFFAFTIAILAGLTLAAQEKLYIHQTDHISLGATISAADSIYFNPEGSMLYMAISGQRYAKPTCQIDSLTFGSGTDTILIKFNGSEAFVTNPMAFEGVSVTTSGAYVTVNATTETRDITYLLSGTTSNGGFKLYSEKRFNLVLNNVTITNPVGPAINIQSNNKATVVLTDNSINTLADGETYDTAPFNDEEEEEDQKATFFSEGKMVFTGNGSLTVNSIGSDQHAIASDENIVFENGNITVTQSVKDAIHAKNGFEMTDGTVSLTSASDGIDADEGYVYVSGGTLTITVSVADKNAISCDSTMIIAGGTIILNHSGDQSKGLKSGQWMQLLGGNITINSLGNVVLEASGSGYDPAYCTAIKCDTLVTLDGANITLKVSGKGGRGLSSDQDISIISGQLNITNTGSGTTYTNSLGTKDAYVPCNIKADGALSILGGTVTLSSSGAGGKGISVNGNLTIGSTNSQPEVSITTTGSKITISTSGSGPNASTNAAEAKAISANGSVTVNNGNISISSADDGIKSETSVTVNNGTVLITKSNEAIESFKIIVNGGYVNLTASNDGINATAGTTSGGTESNDNSYFTVNGGTVVAACSNGDAIDSNGNILITGGTVIANGPSSGVEEACDFNGNFNMNGGYFIGAGSSSNMTKAMSSTSTQNNLYISSSGIISSSSLFHIQDANGNEIVTFKPLNGGYKFLFSSSNLLTGSSYSIYTGGTYTGGSSSDGIYTGGTYSGGTQKKNFTISNKVTSVSF